MYMKYINTQLNVYKHKVIIRSHKLKRIHIIKQTNQLLQRNLTVTHIIIYYMPIYNYNHFSIYIYMCVTYETTVSHTR